MAMVPAKCTNCGGQIEVDSSKEAGICKHCGTAFITEKAINNYTTTYNVTNHVTKIINGKEVEDGEDFYNRAMTHFKLEEYNEARESIEKAIKKNPDNAEFRFAEVLIESKNLTDLHYVLHDKMIDKLLVLATDKQKQQWTKDYGLDFTQTKNDMVVDVYTKMIKDCDFDRMRFNANLLSGLNKEQISRLFASVKNNVITYLKYIHTKNHDEKHWGLKYKEDVESLLLLAFENNIYNYKEKCEIISAYLDAYIDPDYKVFSFDETNYKLFVKNDAMYVPYQQIEHFTMFSFSMSKVKNGKFPSILYVTPNIVNAIKCKELEGKYFDSVVYTYYDEEDEEILKEIYGTDTLVRNNTFSKPKKKKSAKSGGLFGWLKR